MEIYDSLLGAVCDEYDRVTLIKKKRAGRSNLDTPQGKRKPLYFQTFFRQQ